MKKWFLFCGSIFFCARLFCQSVPPAPFAPQTVKAFADALFVDGFFSEAESEYKRYLFAVQQPDSAAIFPLTTIYHTQRNKTGILWLNNTFYAAVEPPLQEKIGLVHGRLLFLERDTAAYAAFYANTQPSLAQFSLDFQHGATLAYQLLAEDIPAATQTAQAAATTNAVFAPVLQLCQDYAPKSAALAVFLSCLVPGLGKWYGGTFGGFTTDFLAVGSCAAGAVYTGIQSDWKDWRPYVFGTAAVTLFAVDIYGTYKNIKRYNAAQLRHIYEAMDTVYESLY